MRLIVGLGNPGTKYEHTRHNAGFDALSILADRLGIQNGKLKGNALVYGRAYRRREGDPLQAADLYEFKRRGRERADGRFTSSRPTSC